MSTSTNSYIEIPLADIIRLRPCGVWVDYLEGGRELLRFDGKWKPSTRCSGVFHAGPPEWHKFFETKTPPALFLSNMLAVRNRSLFVRRLPHNRGFDYQLKSIADTMITWSRGGLECAVYTICEQYRTSDKFYEVYPLKWDTWEYVK